MAIQNPEKFKTGEKVQTSRGSFSAVSLSLTEMKELGYGVHHKSEDGLWLIMGDGTRAFAVRNIRKEGEKIF